MSFIATKSGGRHDVTLDANLYTAARDADMSVVNYINREFTPADMDPQYGTAFQQICASAGLTLKSSANPFGTNRDMSVADILEGKAHMQVAGSTNTSGRSTPYGNESRILFPAAVIAYVEDVLQPDRVTDNSIFRGMVAQNMSIDRESFMQPVISYANAGGANTGTNGAKAQRITQTSGAPLMLKLTTSDKFRNLPVYGIGMEMSDQALRNTTLDLMTMTMNRYIQIERDQRVYTYLSNVFAGDSDHNTGAVSAVTSSTLNGSATSGVLTHKAWVKWLARNRRVRKITHVMADIDTYLKVEGRTGRPGSNNYDPTLARIDPQARMINDTFGGDVVWFLVDSAAEGGPVPANTIWGLDKAQALMMVNNVSAAYQATQRFVLERKETFVMHWGEDCFRLYGDVDLRPFDVLTID